MLSRARLETPSRGPMRRADAPPMADAQSSGKSPNAAKHSAAPQPCSRCAILIGFSRHAAVLPLVRLRASTTPGAIWGCSFPDKSSSLSGTRDGSQQLVERFGITPRDFNLEDLDSRSLFCRHSDDVLCGRNQAGPRALGGTAQLVDFAGAKRVMVRKGAGFDQLGRPTSRKIAKNFSGRPIPANASRRSAGQPIPGNWPQSRRYDRQGSANSERFRITRRSLGAEQYNHVGAGEPAGEAFAQGARGDHPSIAEAVGVIDDQERHWSWRWSDSGSRHRERPSPPPTATAARTPSAR